MYRRQARVYCEGNGIETYRRSALHVHGVRAAGQDDHVGHQPLHSLLRPPCAHPTTHSQSPASPPARRSSLASRHVRRRWVLRVWSDSGGSGQMESDSVRNCTGPTRVCRRQHSRIASTCQTLARRPLQRRSDEGRRQRCSIGTRRYLLRIARQQRGVHAQLTDTARDELRVLRAEVQHQHATRATRSGCHLGLLSGGSGRISHGELATGEGKGATSKSEDR